MSNKPRILVLLSSWNGAKFIEAQLHSILNQEVDAELKILIRDDGSTDNTISLVESLQRAEIELIRGENLGAKASFLQLIKEAANREADYFALADQDDVWLPLKLQAGISQLKDMQGPGLYCSALSLVDEELRPLSKYVAQDKIGYIPAIFTNINTGCTCIINQPLVKLLQKQPDPNAILMHDWWIYLVATIFGQVIYDHNSYIWYRQHSQNQVGLSTGLASYLQRFKRFCRRPDYPGRVSQAAQLLTVYAQHELGDEVAGFVNQLKISAASFFGRVKFALRYYPARKKLSDQLIGFVVFVLKR